jgi:hypothetical protein
LTLQRILSSIKVGSESEQIYPLCPLSEKKMESLNWLPCGYIRKNEGGLVKAIFILGAFMNVPFKKLYQAMDKFFENMAKKVATENLPQFIDGLYDNNSPAWIYFADELERRENDQK